jgi:hypothetical protein
VTQQHRDALLKSAANIKKQRDAAKAEAEKIQAERDALLKLQQQQKPRT